MSAQIPAETPVPAPVPNPGRTPGRAAASGGTRGLRGFHAAGVPRRARADLVALVVLAVLVALASTAALGAPRLADRAAERALRSAVVDAGRSTDLLMTTSFVPDPGGVRRLDPSSEDAFVDRAAQLTTIARSALPGVLGTPVAVAATPPLTLVVPGRGTGALTLRLVDLWHGGAPPVRWLSGGPGAATVTAEEVAAGVDTAQRPLEVGLSEEVAAGLGVGVGDSLATVFQRQDVAVAVSGVFRPQDPSDPAWAAVPGLLTPSTSGTGPAAGGRFAGLLSAASLAQARLLDTSDATALTYAFPVDPAAVTADGAGDLARAAARAEAEARPSTTGAELVVSTRLDDVLVAAALAVAAATAQGSVLVVGVLVALALTLVAAASLLARRRRPLLLLHRARGATTAGIAGELLVESAVVTAVGAGAGALLAALLVPGPVDLARWAPVLLVAVLAPPALGLAAATEPPPAGAAGVDRARARSAAGERRWRAVAVDAAVVLAAAGAIAALLTRGVAGTSGAARTDLLVAAAPALAAVAAALLALRLLTPALAVAARRSHRSAALVPGLLGERLRVGAGRALPFLALALAAALASLSLVLVTTVRAGQVDASWALVGADVAVTTAPGAGLADAAAVAAQQPGVRAAVAARVEEEVQLLTTRGGQRVRVVAADPTALAGLLATTPLPDAPALAALATVAGASGTAPTGSTTTATGSGEQLAVLVGPAADASPGDAVTLRWQGADLPAVVVGTTPALGPPGADPTLVVDVAALAGAVADAATTATGAVEADPDVLWVVGPGARAAVDALPGLEGADVADRAAVLAGLRSAPLPAGLSGLAVLAAALLLALAVTTSVLTAAAGAPERRGVLLVLRSLGLGRSGRLVVSGGELVVPATAAAVVGSAVGVGLAALVRGPLALRLVTGQAGEPALVVPGWVALPVVVALLTAAVLAAAESSAVARADLGSALRSGQP